MQMEQRGSAADSLHDLPEDNQDKPVCKSVEDYHFQCNYRDVDGESKTEETEMCKELEQRQEEDQGNHPDDELDPRIQEELEHLNASSDEINRMELELEEERSNYRRILSDLGRRLSALSSKLGSCIEKARPFYEARRVAKEAQQETQKAALGYERAVSMHAAAREMVHVAEQRLGAAKTLDQTWQEMLNHATAKVNEAEEERLRSEREHMRVTQMCQAAEAHVQTLQKSLNRTISKSKPYFELKAQLNSILEEHKLKVTVLEEHLTEAKKRYSFTLQSLEKISEEIHAQREQDNSEDGSTECCGARSPPVGAEAVSNTGSEIGHRVVTKSNGWLNGEETKTQEWVETHTKSGWWENKKPIPVMGVCSDSSSGFSFKTVVSDFEKFDSLTLCGEVEEKQKKADDERNLESGGKQQNNEKVDVPEKNKQEQLIRQHQRTVSF